MDQKILLAYLTDVDKKLHELISLEPHKCPYTPHCRTYKADFLAIKDRKQTTCTTDRLFIDRYRICDEYNGFVLEKMEKEANVPRDILPLLIRTIWSFDYIPCSFKNCKKYDPKGSICNDELTLVKRMNDCESYEKRMLRRVMRSLKNLNLTEVFVAQEVVTTT